MATFKRDQFYKAFFFTALVVSAFGLGQKYPFAITRDLSIHWLDVSHAGEVLNADSKNVCERTVANGTVKYGEPEVYQFHVNTTPMKVCQDVSNAFELGQDLECQDLENGKDPNETVYVDMRKGHYLCLKNARYIGPKISGDYCLDLYELTER